MFNIDRMLFLAFKKASQLDEKILSPLPPLAGEIYPLPL